jgi:hypothetical protein
MKGERYGRLYVAQVPGVSPCRQTLSAFLESYEKNISRVQRTNTVSCSMRTFVQPLPILYCKNITLSLNISQCTVKLPTPELLRVKIKKKERKENYGLFHPSLLNQTF